MSNFFEELKKRNVYKAATAYGVTSWLVIQVVNTIGPNLSLPNSIPALVTKILLVGFPIALILTWLYEFTPKGLKRTGKIQQETSDNRRAGRRLNRVIITTLTLLLCVLLVDRLFSENTSINEKQKASIAVLPFEYLSDNANHGFVKGLVEQITSDLSAISGLSVRSSNSSFSFQGKNVDDHEIGEQLNVNYLLKGSLQYDSIRNRIKIVPRLINVNNGYSLWFNAYEDNFDEIFTIQEDVSRNIIDQLKVELTPEEEESLGTELTKNKDAYKLYLESKNYSKKRTGADLEQAIKLLKKAVQMESDFAEAHAELSYLYGNLFYYGNISREERDDKMKYHLDQAIRIAPDKAEVLWAKARYYVGSVKDSSQVIADLRRAIELKPSYSDAHYSLARALNGTGFGDLALKSFESAVRYDPKNEFLQIQLADWYYIYGYEEIGLQKMRDLVTNDSVGLSRYAIMISKQPKGDLVQAFKLIHQASKKDHNKGQYTLGSFNDLSLFSLDLDLWPISEKYASQMQSRYPENSFTFHVLKNLYSFKKQFSLLEETADYWIRHNRLNTSQSAIVQADVSISNRDFQKARKIFEDTYPNISSLKVDSNYLEKATNYENLWNYVEILRLNNDDEKADNYAKSFCEFYNNSNSESVFISSHEKNFLQLDCYYLSNDTLAFVQALEERFFIKKDRLGVYSDLKCGNYGSRFEGNKEFQDLFDRIRKETHRMRTEVIAYLKEEGDWNEAWDKELGLE